MLNLINMNLTRLFKTKALYVTSMITFVLIFLFAFYIGGTDLAGLTNELGMAVTLSMVGIFSGIYSDEERKSGFLKNLETSKAKKGNVFLAKVPVMVLYSLIIILVAITACAIGLMKSEGAFAGLNPFNLITFIVFQTLFHASVGTGFIAVYEISRGLVAPIVLAFMFAGGTHLLIIDSIQKKIAAAVPALGVFFENIIAPTELSAVTLSKYTKLGAADTPYVAVLIIGAILLVAYSLVGTTIFRKRDTF